MFLFRCSSLPLFFTYMANTPATSIQYILVTFDVTVFERLKEKLSNAPGLKKTVIRLKIYNPRY